MFMEKLMADGHGLHGLQQDMAEEPQKFVDGYRQAMVDVFRKNANQLF